MDSQPSRNLSPGDSDDSDRSPTKVYELEMITNIHTNDYLESVSFPLTKPVDKIHNNSIVMKSKKTKKKPKKPKKHKMIKKTKKNKKIKKNIKKIKKR